jgi:serine protease Do
MARLLAVLVVLVFVAPAWTQTSPAKPVTPWYVDDERAFDQFIEKLTALAKAKKGIATAELARMVETVKPLKADVTLATPRSKPLAPEDVYESILPSVVLLGSVKPTKDDPDEFEDGGFGTAWCLSADGVFVTNRHMFAEAKSEWFGIATHTGEVHPVVEILAVDVTADVAVFRVEGKGFTPLPLAESSARVGAWVATLGHPGNQLYTFTQGHVTRYSKEKTEAGVERWMTVTAEYAQGSSGGPIVDRFGNVVGMAALTASIDAIEDRPADDKKPDPAKPKAKPEELSPPASALQMVVKLSVPLDSLRATIRK